MFFLGAVVALAASSQAVLINEVFVNAPGSDDGHEFFELRSDQGATSLSGLSILVIEGDNFSSGTIDQVIDLGAFSTGSNGLFLMQEPSGNNPGPDGDTVVESISSLALENGSFSLLLVDGFTGSEGDDIDADDDGAIDNGDVGTVVDGVGWTDGGTDDRAYGHYVFDPSLDFTPDGAMRILGSNEWTGYDVVGSTPGPYAFEPLAFASQHGTLLSDLTFDTVSGGFDNPEVVPEPATLGLAALGALLIRRRKRSG